MRRIALVVTLVSASALRPNAQPGVEQFISAIEGPQSGREGELVALPLKDAMKKAGVPGVSVAVIKDFDIHWAGG